MRGLDAPFTTAFFRLEGVPGCIVGRRDELRRYVAALHASLRAAYVSRDMPMPAWRSWTALHRRWPWLLHPPPTGATRVHVVRPL